MIRRRPRSGLRLVIRLASLGWFTFVAAMLLTGVWASPASADNCSVFTDCFGQSGAAAEAALGLTLLAGLSLVVDFIPIVGDVKGLIEMRTGRDLFTGEELAPWERSLGLIGLLPGGDLVRLVGVGSDVIGSAGSVGRNIDAIGGVRGAGRSFDGADGLGAGRGVDSAGGTRGVDSDGGGLPPLRGDGPSSDLPPLRRGDDGADIGVGPGPRQAGDPVAHRSHRPDLDNAVNRYLDDGATPAQRTRISEEIGEHGAADYVEEVTGRQLDITRPTTDADVADLVDRFDNGEAWDEVVAFNGRNATNMVYYDGETLHIIEAKGGAGTYGDRASNLNAGQRISQTDPNYPLDVAQDMMNSSRTDGRNSIGDLIEQAFEEDTVSYVGVRSAGHNTGGEVETTLEHIFRSPPD